MAQAAEMENQYDLSHMIGHAVSGLAVIVSFIGLLAPVASVAAATVGFVWYFTQLYEGKTVQRFLRSRRARKIAAYQVAIERLLAQQKIDMAEPLDAPKSTPAH
jgi:hypothetical protein